MTKRRVNIGTVGESFLGVGIVRDSIIMDDAEGTIHEHEQGDFNIVIVGGSPDAQTKERGRPRTDIYCRWAEA